MSTNDLKKLASKYISLDDVYDVCKECGRQYETQRLLKAHMRIHTKAYRDQRYTCSTCGKVYKSNVNLLSHFNTIHLGQKNFFCEQCGKTFSRGTSLSAHKKLHDGIKQFQCNYCNVAYAEKRNLMNHIARNHLDSEQSRCIWCDVINIQYVFKKQHSPGGFKLFLTKN